MSILQEYENIRKEIGENKYTAIEKYLNIYEDLLLSDIYYKKAEWDKFEKWYNKTQDVINTLIKSDCVYSVSYWTEGNEDRLASYIEDGIHYYGLAYKNEDNTIKIYRFQTDGSDLEEWLVIGLTEKEIIYISDEITHNLLKGVK